MELKRQEAQTSKFAEDLGSFLSTNLRRLLKRLEDEKVTAIEAAKLLGSLEAKMSEIGLDRQISEITKLHLDEIDSAIGVLEASTGVRATFAAADLEVLHEIIRFDEQVISNKVAQYIGDLKPVMMRSILGGQKIDAEALLGGATPTLVNQVQTEVDTALKAFSRSIVTSKAKESGFDYFEYLGPDDSVTREFCQDVLEGNYPGLERSEPIYTVDEIESMDNGQDLPVMEYCGGYNCRHQWRPISNEEANSRLKKD